MSRAVLPIMEGRGDQKVLDMPDATGRSRRQDSQHLELGRNLELPLAEVGRMAAPRVVGHPCTLLLGAGVGTDSMAQTPWLRGLSGDSRTPTSLCSPMEMCTHPSCRFLPFAPRLLFLLQVTGRAPATLSSSSAAQHNSGGLMSSRPASPRTGACRGQSAQRGKTGRKHISGAFPTHAKVLCIGGATRPLLPPDAQPGGVLCGRYIRGAAGSRLWGTASGALALAKAKGQLRRGDQDGAEDGPVALGQDLGVLRHHLQHHVPHLPGDVTPEIQQGGDVLVAGWGQEGSPGWCWPTAPSTVLVSRKPPRSELGPGESC